MTELHGKKWGAQHPGTDRSVEGGVYGAVTVQRETAVSGVLVHWGAMGRGSRKEGRQAARSRWIWVVIRQNAWSLLSKASSRFRRSER